MMSDTTLPGIEQINVQIEQDDDAITILQKYHDTHACIVCDNPEFDRERLLERKQASRKRIYESLDKKTKELLDKVVRNTELLSSDPFNIKAIVSSFISDGNPVDFIKLQEELKVYVHAIGDEMIDSMIHCFDGTSLLSDFDEYIRLTQTKPELDSEELLYIEDVINAVHEVLGDAPNANAKANMQTASNISTATPAPAAPAQATSIPDPNAAAASLAAVPTTPTTTIQPTNPAAGPAPMPQQVQQPTPQDPNGGISANFNQAPIAMPGAIPAMQSMANQAIGATPAPVAQATTQIANPMAGAVQAPAAQMAQTTTPVQTTVPQVPQQTMSPANFTVAAPPIPQLAPNAPVPTVPLPMPPIPPQLLQQYMQQGSVLQTPDRVLPNAQLSAAIQAAEATARMRNEQKQESAEQKTAGGEGRRCGRESCHDYYENRKESCGWPNESANRRAGSIKGTRGWSTARNAAVTRRASEESKPISRHKQATRFSQGTIKGSAGRKRFRDHRFSSGDRRS